MHDKPIDPSPLQYEASQTRFKPVEIYLEEWLLIRFQTRFHVRIKSGFEIRNADLIRI